MTKLQQHLTQEAHEWRMSEAEKRVMRGSLEAHMSAHPLGGMVSPYSWVSFTAVQRFALVPILILMLGSGTAYAAQGALPGDALYPVKVGVTEKISGALAFSDEAKASFNTEVAAERIKEGQSLAAQNKLSTSATNELANDYEVHALLAASYADKVESDDAAKGAELHANLASLGAEGVVLTTVAAQEGNTETQENAARLAEHTGASNRVEEQPARAAATLAMAATPAPTPSSKQSFAAQTMSLTVQANDVDSTPDDSHEKAVNPKTIAALQVQALSQLDSLKRAVKNAQKTATASTSAALDARLEAQQTLLDEAQNVSDSDALKKYQRALSQGTVLKTFLSASKKFKLNILTPLLQVRTSNSSKWNDDDSGSRSDEHSDRSVPGVQSEVPTPQIDASSDLGVQTGGEAPSVDSSVETDVSSEAPPSPSPGASIQSVITTVVNGLHLSR